MFMKLFVSFLVMELAGKVLAQQASSAAQPTNPPPVLSTNAAPTIAPINEAGNFGLGPLIGEPTGLSVKYWLSDKMAIDGGAAWSFVDPDGFQLHADFLFHKFDLFHISDGSLPLYFGAGGRVKFVEHGDNRAGLRGPVGVSYFIPKSRVELFAEVAPVLDLAPTTTLEWNGGIGLRVYFH